MTAASSAAPIMPRLLQFVRFLRQHGFTTGVQEAQDCLRFAAAAEVFDEKSMQAGLRCLLCRSRDDWRRFDDLFERFWHPRRLIQRQPPPRRDPRMIGQRRGGSVGLSGAAEETATTVEANPGSGGAGRHKALARSDFRCITEQQAMQTMQHLAEQLARRLRQRLLRRQRLAQRGRQLHMRRTLRRNLAHGGLPLVLSFKERQRQWPRFVLILDISHSMAAYNPLLTRFLRGLLLTFRDSEAFMFHTRLYRVTELFRQTDAETLRRRLENMSPLWFGGTRIAESLKSFNRAYGGRLVNSRTFVLILSDGFDTDAPELLIEELRRLKRRAGKLLWLNPMLNQENEPIDDPSLLAALPLLDRLVPAHSLANLEAVADYLATL